MTTLTNDIQNRIAEIVEEYNDGKFGTYKAVMNILRLIGKADSPYYLDVVGDKIEKLLLTIPNYSLYMTQCAIINNIQLAE